MRISLPFVLVAAYAVGAPARAQDPTALASLLETRFAHAAEGQVHEFLAAADAAGLTPGAAERAVAKATFAAFVAGADPAHEARGEASAAAAPQVLGSGTAGPAGATGADHEYNDTVGFAETLELPTGGSCTVTGGTGGTDARDVYRLVLTGPSWENEVSIVASAAATPPVCNLFDEAGRLVAVGLSPFAGSRGLRRIGLPLGTYYVNVVGTGYVLTVTATATEIPQLASGNNQGVVNPNGVPAEVFDVSSWKLTLGTHESVRFAFASTPSVPVDHDLFVNLGRRTAGRVHFCDDVLPAPPNANDPDLEAGLPPGTYYVFVQNSVAGASQPIPYTLVVARTPIVPASLCGSTNHGFTRSGQRGLFALSLTQPQRVSIRTANGSAPPSSPDAYVELFDADMGMLMHNDDGCPSTGCGLHSYLDATLPAGTYYLTFRGYAAAGNAGEFGDYLVTGSCDQPPQVTPLGAMRVEPQTYAAGASATWSFTAVTDTPLVVSHGNNCHVIGCDGRLRASYQQLVSPGSTTECGLRLHAGETVWLVHRTTTGAATSAATLFPYGRTGIDLVPQSPGGAFALQSVDKVGRLQGLVLSVGRSPVPFAVPPLGGFLGLHPATLQVLGFHQFVTSPRLTWPLPDLRPFLPPQFVPGIAFQAVSLDGTFAGAFTNVAAAPLPANTPPNRTANLYSGAFPEGIYDDLDGEPGQPIALPNSLGPIHAVSFAVAEGYCPFEDFAAVHSGASVTLDIQRAGIYFIDVEHGTDARTKFVVNVKGGGAKAWPQPVGVPGPVLPFLGYDLYVAEAGPGGRLDFVDCAADYYRVPAANRFNTVAGLNALIAAREQALRRPISVVVIGHGAAGYVSMGATAGNANEFIGRNQQGAAGKDQAFLVANRGKVTRVAFYSCAVAGAGVQYIAGLAAGLKVPGGPAVRVDAYDKCVWAWCSVGNRPAQIGLSRGGNLLFWQTQ